MKRFHFLHGALCLTVALCAGCASFKKAEDSGSSNASGAGLIYGRPGGVDDTRGGKPSLRASGPVIQVNGSAPSTFDLSAYRLKPLDPIFIALRGIPRPDEIEDRVDENGNINLSYIGTIRAAGKTTSELEKAIEQRYITEDIYRNINVNVVVPAQSYYVRGEVRQPGRYPLIGGVTLLQAIAAAGGFSEFANTKRVKVIRGDTSISHNLRELEQAPEKDEDVEAGDVIVVPRSVF